LPSKYRLKNLFKGKLVELLTKLFIKLKFSPNLVSIFGFLNTILAIILFFIIPYPFNCIVFGIFIFWLMLLDGVDGTLARMTNQITHFGGVLDSVLDRYSDSLLLIAFLFIYPVDMLFLFIPIQLWVMVGVLGFIMVSYTRSRGEKELIGDLNVGLGARTERLFILFIFSLLLMPWIGLIITVFLSHLTVIYRVVRFYHLSDEKSK